MIVAGNVMRLPADRPNSMQTAISARGSLVAVSASSAAAWLATDHAANRRMSNRAAKAPNAKRPVIAVTVSAATAKPACARPSAGSRIAIW